MNCVRRFCRESSFLCRKSGDFHPCAGVWNRNCTFLAVPRWAVPIRSPSSSRSHKHAHTVCASCTRKLPCSSLWRTGCSCCLFVLLPSPELLNSAALTPSVGLVPAAERLISDRQINTSRQRNGSKPLRWPTEIHRGLPPFRYFCFRLVYGFPYRSSVGQTYLHCPPNFFVILSFCPSKASPWDLEEGAGVDKNISTARPFFCHPIFLSLFAPSKVSCIISKCFEVL